ncbi:MAG: hypothetical protein HYY00_00320 [Chloroflexi bacterium]|nr:hypothetical protein [Chloroflexota bacterium]
MPIRSRGAALAQLSVVSLYVADGGVQEQSPYVETVRARWMAGGGELWVMAEPVGPTDLAGARAALSYFMEALPSRRASVTSSISAAIAACHQRLRSGGEEEPRLAVALSCVLLRGQKVYLAQAGPALAYVLEAGEARRLKPTLGHVHAVGVAAARPGVSFHHQEMEEGDRVLVAFGVLDEMLPVEGVASLLRPVPSEAMRKVYLLAHDRAPFSALLVYLS